MTEAESIIAACAQRGYTIAVAESLTGGLVCSELVGVPGASTVFLGGVVAYNTELKTTLLGVDRALLAAHGPVHESVAGAMAEGVRERLGVGTRASFGIATTGVAGPERDEHGGNEPGTAFIAVSSDAGTVVTRLTENGTRQEIRAAVARAALSAALGEILQGTR